MTPTRPDPTLDGIDTFLRATLFTGAFGFFVLGFFFTWASWISLVLILAFLAVVHLQTFRLARDNQVLLYRLLDKLDRDL